MTTECSVVRNRHGDVVIQVKAQVMARDDSSGGWVPVSGGGLSRVALLKDIAAVQPAAIVTQSDDLKMLSAQSECGVGGVEDTNSALYVIEGHRMTDDAVVLKCTLKLDIQYVAANPMFHHWRMGSKRYGLTFQSPSDARAFERCVRRAASEMTHSWHRQCLPHSKLQRQCTPTNEDIFMMLHFNGDHREASTESADSELASTESSPLRGGGQTERDSVTYCQCTSCMMALTAPHAKSYLALPFVSEVADCGLQTQFHQSTDRADLPGARYCTGRHHLVEPHDDVNNIIDGTIEESLENEYNNQLQFLEESRKGLNEDDVLSLDSSYVRFAKTELNPRLGVDVNASVHHEYCYPMLDTLNVRRDISCVASQRPNCPPAVRHAIVPLPSRLPSRQPPEAVGSRLVELGIPACHHQRRELCVHCGEWFDVDGGRRQRCADARDNVTDCISVATCACVADAVAYHCLADAEGDYDPTCSCSSSSGGGTRWMVYVLLSLLLPCLCCYWPLIGCRQCAARCGCCITHHEAARKEILDV